MNSLAISRHLLWKDYRQLRPASLLLGYHGHNFIVDLCAATIGERSRDHTSRLDHARAGGTDTSSYGGERHFDWPRAPNASLELVEQFADILDKFFAEQVHCVAG